MGKAFYVSHESWDRQLDFIYLQKRQKEMFDLSREQTYSGTILVAAFI